MAYMSKPTILFCLLFAAVYCMAQNEKTPEFPNTEEINLVVTQSERVFEEYKQSITMEAELPSSKQNPSVIEKDREGHDMAAKLVTTLKAHPEGFHGLGGLLLLSSLDDASRNAAVCSSSAYSDAMNAVISTSDVDSAKESLHVGLSCIEVSGYLPVHGQ
jgi:hypothetical protein